MAADELVDEIDADDRVVRSVTRAQMRADNLLHRVVAIVVFGSDGRLLIHQRSPTKDVWPGRWDVAAGGVVGAGEAYDAAARRELGEELGVHADLRPLGAYGYEDDRTQYRALAYRADHDGPFAFTDDEVVAVRWVTPPELAGMRATVSFCPDGFLPLAFVPGWA